MKRIKNIRSDITKINNMESLYPNQVNASNNEGLLEVFKEKSDREKQGSDE